jgi:hypothetical protein
MMSCESREATPYATGSYRYYVLGLLTVILLFNYVDRLALGIALESVKAEFSLTDTQLGFLGGIAFAIFYSIMGIPIARWADRGNRGDDQWAVARTRAGIFWAAWHGWRASITVEEELAHAN